MNVPRLFLPVLVVAALFGGYSLRLAFTQPTTEVRFGEAGPATLSCVVEGLKCKGTANFFGGLYEGRPGIGSIETFATEHRAVITYDPAVITPDDIRAVMEAPVRLADGRHVRPFRCVEMATPDGVLTLGPPRDAAPPPPARPRDPW